MELGETKVTVRIYGPTGHEDVEMLADTGATISKIPDSVAKKTGVEIVGDVQVELADGSLKKRGQGYAEIELLGTKRLVPILVGPDGESALLGLTTLEILQFKVNPLTRKLERANLIEYYVG